MQYSAPVYFDVSDTNLTTRPSQALGPDSQRQGFVCCTQMRTLKIQEIHICWHAHDELLNQPLSEQPCVYFDTVSLNDVNLIFVLELRVSPVGGSLQTTDIRDC